MATEWYLAKKEELTEIATAIRNLNGGNAGLKLNDMKNAINTEKSNLEAVKTALKGKGVTVADGAVLSDLSGLIDGIETGGGSSWTDSYSVFATGTFTPTENLTNYSIDTGVPFDSSNYLKQFLIVWREPSSAISIGFYIGMIRAFTLTGASSKSHVGRVAGYGGTDMFVAKALMESEGTHFPDNGDTIWTIAGLVNYLQFQSGKPYRWMLLGC